MNAHVRFGRAAKLTGLTALALAGLALATPARTAEAGVHVSIGFGLPVVHAPVYVAPPPPVYVAPAPVYYRPAYYAPRPVVRVAAPVWVRGYWECGHWVPGRWR
ncbi:MAG: hypothetical protein IPK07_28345 [Deltaproteobacteria bacterium]|nr:hypothetical protein [Deltaproteobacteria bacterium]